MFILHLLYYQALLRTNEKRHAVLINGLERITGSYYESVQRLGKGHKELGGKTDKWANEALPISAEAPAEARLPRLSNLKAIIHVQEHIWEWGAMRSAQQPK